MTYKQALKTLSFSLGSCATTTIEEAVSVAMESLKKQIPKKPIDEEDDDFYHCPVCDMQIGTIQPYCDRCGQAIDWSDEQ